MQPQFIFTTTSYGRYYPHFADEETEADASGVSGDDITHTMLCSDFLTNLKDQFKGLKSDI